MKNIFFPDEEVTENDLYFLCYMIERIARKLHQRNKYVVNAIPYEEWMRLISLADVLHCENPLKIENEWIVDYNLKEGDFYVTNVDHDLVDVLPTETQIARVYKRLITQTQSCNENYVDAMIRVYNNDICEILDNYNAGAYYEPSYCITRAYNNGGFFM